MRRDVDLIKQEIIANPALTEYINSLWCDLKTGCRLIWATRIQRFGKKLLPRLGRSQEQDLKDSINDHLEGMTYNPADRFLTAYLRNHTTME